MRYGLGKIESYQRLGRADIHIHSRYSDGQSKVEEILDFVETKTDLDVIAITDHDTIEGALEAKALMKRGKYRFELIIGEEVTSREGHILGLFLERPVLSGLSAEETVDAIHHQGGVAIAVHPFEKSRWNNRELPVMNGVGFMTLLKINHKFDAIEVVNATPTLGDENLRAALANKTFLFQAEIGSSDAHILEAIGKGYTLFEGNAAMEFKNAILEHQTRAMHNEWTILALLKYAYFFTPRALRILWNTILHGRTKLPEE